MAALDPWDLVYFGAAASIAIGARSLIIGLSNAQVDLFASNVIVQDIRRLSALRESSKAIVEDVSIAMFITC